MPTTDLERCSLVDALIARGFRLTRQRRLLLQTIEQSSNRLDATSLLKLARERDIDVDRATVYRTLDLLKKQHLIDELISLRPSSDRHFYEARPHQQFIHLPCIVCGRIQEVRTQGVELLKQDLEAQAGFELGSVRMEVGGRCRDCKARLAADADAQQNASLEPVAENTFRSIS